MKTLVLNLCLVTLLVAGFAAADDDHYHHHHGDVADLELKHDEHGERWPTDDSLRQGMDNILSAFDGAHGGFRADRLDRQGAAALAEEVEDQVRFIFANCALPADADAELHKLLAAILGAAATLREDDDVHAGLHQLHSALKIYGEYFDHPGWSA